MADDKWPPKEVIELTDIIEEGLPLDSLSEPEEDTPWPAPDGFEGAALRPPAEKREASPPTTLEDEELENLLREISAEEVDELEAAETPPARKMEPESVSAEPGFEPGRHRVEIEDQESPIAGDQEFDIDALLADAAEPIAPLTRREETRGEPETEPEPGPVDSAKDRAPAGETDEADDSGDEKELDDLLSGLEAEGSIAEPEDRPEHSPAGKDILDQADLDVLLKQAGPRKRAPQIEKERPEVDKSQEMLDQAQLDALLEEVKAEEPEPVAEVARKTAERKEDIIDQSTLDRLLAEASLGFESQARPAQIEPFGEEDMKAEADEAGRPAPEMEKEPAPVSAAAPRFEEIDPARVEQILTRVAREVFEKAAREIIPRITEEVLTREIAALRRELDKSGD